MINVSQAEKILKNIQIDWGYHKQKLEHCLAEILAESIYSDRDLPPYNRVAMDGYALCFSKIKKGQKNFVIEAVQKAGDKQLRLLDSAKCINVSTGASLPKGSDCVIKKEEVELKDNQITLLNHSAHNIWHNIHIKGSDNKKGILLIPQGRIISPVEIGIMASVGKSKVKVKRKPKILIVATGNELVGVDKKPKNHQIRLSNIYVIAAGLSAKGFCDVHSLHLRDDFSIIKSAIASYLKKYDVVIFSGGVSAGDFDFLPEALKNNKVKTLFYKIKQKPGKPIWVGQKENKLVFALPGNPVSTTICLYKYVIFCLENLLKIKSTQSEVIRLTKPISCLKQLTLFQPVVLVRKNNSREGELWGEPIKMNGSGDFSALTKSDGFVQCPAIKSQFNEGEELIFYRWRNK